MKKKNILYFLSLSLFLFGCDNGNSEIKIEKEPGQIDIKVSSYKLESLASVFGAISKTTISGNTFYVDPYTSSYILGEVVSRYPDSNTLEGVNVLYTSNWYKTKTCNRSNVTEYLLVNENNSWIVQDIYNKSSNYIPLNCAILSVPNNSGLVFDEFDTVPISYSIDTDYKISFHNDDDYRMVIKSCNENTWASKSLNYYDEGNLKGFTRTNYERLSLMNVAYKNGKYVVSNFRSFDNVANQNNRVEENGFCVASSLADGTVCVSTISGVRFKINDVLHSDDNYVENNSISLAIGNNTVYSADGTKTSFSMSKVTTPVNSYKYGYEVAVNKNNYVTDFGCNVDIPSGGYKLAFRVISPTNAEKLNVTLNNIFKLYSRVSVNKTTYNISFNAFDSSSAFLDQLYSEYEDITEYDIPLSNFEYDMKTINSVHDRLDNISTELESLEDDYDSIFKAYNIYGRLYNCYYALYNSQIRNEVVQNKAFWYIEDYSGRDLNLTNLCAHLDLISSLGYNEIIFYAIKDGLVNYSNSELFTQRSSIANKDYSQYGADHLKALISEAHKRNMKVFTCVTPFTCGLEKAFPELKNAQALSIDGKTFVTSSQGKVEMLDPANSLVQDKIKAAINDILKCNPELDGIHLDYIRYGADNNYLNTVMGVTESSVQGFNNYLKDNKYTFSFSSLTDLRNGLKSSSDYLSKFNMYEQSLITNTVKNVKDVCKEYNVPLTCAVADDYEYVKSWKCQDWVSWANNNLVDGLYIMDYYFDDYYVDYYMKDGLNKTKKTSNTIYVAGIDPAYATISDLAHGQVIKGATLDNRVMGYSIFGTHTQTAQASWYLDARAIWQDSLSPYASLKETVPAILNKLLDNSVNIYQVYDNQNIEQYNNLKADANEIINMLSDDSYELANSILSKVNNMQEKTYASGEANNRIKEQLDLLERVVKLKINIYQD